MEEPADDTRLLLPNRNCWRVEEADRVQFLIDGASYFAAFADIVARAERQVLIVGWDIHGGTRLIRDRNGQRAEDALGPFLCRVLSRHPELQIHVLDWDFSMLFAMERDWTPLFHSSRWTRHARLHFRFDDRHPLGASHHQKIVVVDDTVAFVGGIDLTQRRWDTPAHRADDDRRRDPAGRAYAPFHDVQVLLEGNVASALGELARERWFRATGQRLPGIDTTHVDFWPAGRDPDLRNVPVGVSRTVPSSDSEPAVREVEQLYLDAIGSARRFIYVENQYFTSAVVAGALEQRLREDNGPEILMVLPRDCSGWLEEGTMGLLRARNLERLHQADEHGRFRACYPVTSDDGLINVHAKVLIVDDCLVRVGSSNLSNRSMGLDTECDVVIEALGSDRLVPEAIASFRNRLIGEHLGVGESDVTKSLESTRSLTTLVDRLGDGGRGLRAIQPQIESWGVFVPDETLVDPDGPEAPKRAIEEFVNEDVPATTRLPFLRVLLASAVLLGLAAMWRWTPLRSWIDPEAIVSWAVALRDHTLAAAFIVPAAYVVAGLFLLPVTALILATAMTFDPWVAIAYSLVGSVASGLTGFALGHVLARDTVRRLAGTRLNRVSKLLGRGGIVAVIALRMLPVAPFTIANVVAGASHIRLKDFALGTALGLAPGIVAVNLFKSQAQRAIEDPGLVSLLLLGGVLVLIVLGIAWARRSLKELAPDRDRT
jgi:phospholipase D1/2